MTEEQANTIIDLLETMNRRLGRLEDNSDVLNANSERIKEYIKDVDSNLDDVNVTLASIDNKV
jgi:hypothetical protein